MKPFPVNLLGIVDLACRLQQIPSPTFYEQRRAEVVQSEFLHLNLSQISQDVVGNVYACLPGGPGRPLVICAHLDSVYNSRQNPPLIRNSDSITGPGIGDNALGLAALINLAAWLQIEPFSQPGPIWFVANVREEGLGNLEGIRAVVDRFGSSPVAYLILEGMGLGKVYHRGLSIARYNLSVETPGGHSWIDFGQPSSIAIMAKLITQIVALPLPSQPRTSLNFGIIKGGTSVNTIAPFANAELDIRSEDPKVLAALVAQIQEIISTYQGNQVKVGFVQIGMRPAGEIPIEHPLVQLAVRALRDEGVTPLIGIASTDANLPLSKGIPSICIGVTTGSKTHTPQETINLQPIQTGMNVLYHIVSQAWTTATE